MPDRADLKTPLRHETCEQGRDEVRLRREQETSLAPSCWNLRFFRSKCTVLKKVLATWLGLFGGPLLIRRPRHFPPRSALAFGRHKRLFGTPTALFFTMQLVKN